MFGSLLNLMGSGVSAPAARAMRGSMQAGNTAQTATGNNQATAFPIAADITEFSTVAASTGAILPNGPRQYRGDTAFVANQGANALAIYPPVGFQIGTAGVNAAVSIPAGKTAFFLSRGDGNWFANISA